MTANRHPSAPVGDLPVLGTLVGDVEAFRRNHWGVRPLRSRAAADWCDVLTIADVEELLLTGAREPTFRLVRAGQTLGSDRSTRPVRLGGRLVSDAADVERIASAMTDGATLVLQGLQRTTLRVAERCRALERETSHAVQANAYLTPPGSSGLDAHRDEHDVLVVQLTGTKAWNVEGLGAVDVARGDVLYLPAGTEHSATAQEEASLHLTIGLLTTTYGAVIRRLLDRIDDGSLASPLPLGFAEPDRRDEVLTAVSEVVQHVAHLLANAPIQPTVDSEIERSRTRRRPLFLGHIASVLDLHRLGLSSQVQARADQHGRLVTREAGTTVLVLADRELSFPAIGDAALRLLLSGHPVTVGALPAIDDESKLVVVRRLVHEGVVRILSI